MIDAELRRARKRALAILLAIGVAAGASACTPPPPVTSPVYTGRSWICAPSGFLSRTAEVHMLPGTGFYTVSIYMYRFGLGSQAPSLSFDISGTGATFTVPFVPDPGLCMELVSWSGSPEFTVTFTPETDLSAITTFYTYTIFHTVSGVRYP